jgi:transposase
MSQKPVTQRATAEKVVKDIWRATRKQHSAEEKIRIVLSGLRGGKRSPDPLLPHMI